MSQISGTNLPEDEALSSLGRALAAHRVRKNITQSQLALESGVSRSTVARLESGESIQLSALVRVLQALGLADRLTELFPTAQVSPLQVLDNDGKVRKRASRRRQPKADNKGEWTWGEDQ